MAEQLLRPFGMEEEVDLQEIRRRIDALDAQLVQLLCDRMQLSAEVAAYKKAQGMAVLDRTRELEILQNREVQAGEFGAQVREIYEKIFEMSRTYQQQLLK